VARARNVDPSTISRAVARLEEELGFRLLQRTTRRLTLTEAGAVYLERVEPLLDGLEKALDDAAEVVTTPTGTLRVTAPVTFGQIVVVPLLPELASEFPRLDIELMLSDAVVDLVAERFDAAVRLGPLSDSRLIATRLCSLDAVVCASPTYLERMGTPTSPEEVAGHDALVFPLPGWSSRWRFRSVDGTVVEVGVRARVRISNANALRQCALSGMGLALLPRWVVQRDLERGSLVVVLDQYQSSAHDFDQSAWFVYPSRAYLPVKVRIFRDRLRARCRLGPEAAAAAARKGVPGT